MIFFSLMVFLLAAWCGPWWVTALAGFAFGYSGAVSTSADTFKCSATAGLAWAALAYVQDVRNSGLVSYRVAGLMGLPHPILVFLVMAVLGFVTVFLFARSGLAVRGLLRRSTQL